MTNFQAIKETLEIKLFGQAFRQGTSAFRYGLIPLGYSDHLPVEACIRLSQGAFYRAITWNMLSDDHLYNNFMNVTGTDLLFKALGSPGSDANIYGGTATSNKLYYFFSELAQFLVSHQQQETVTVTPELLSQFIMGQPSLLARSRDQEKALLLSDRLKASRRAAVSLLLDKSHPDCHEFELAMAHALELIHHIQKGSLQWAQRLARLREDRVLLQRLRDADMLCFQECTDPNAMLALLNEDGQRFVLITHRIHDRTNDHCAILYDKNRFKVIGEPLRKSFEGKKPYMLLPLEDIQTGECFMLGSIHHPGGAGNHLSEVQAEVSASMPAILLGDYNHTAEHFSGDLTPGFQMLFPRNQGTLAGNDYNHLNRAIDGALTNLNPNRVQLETVSTRPQAPAQTSVGLNFAYAYAGKRMAHQTQAVSHEGNQARVGVSVRA